jgi:hypothetical protein
MRKMEDVRGGNDGEYFMFGWIVEQIVNIWKKFIEAFFWFDDGRFFNL